VGFDAAGRTGTFSAMIPILHLDRPAERQSVEQLWGRLRLDPLDLALERGPHAKIAAIVRQIVEDVAKRGDDAVVEQSRQHDDPDFTIDKMRVPAAEMQQAAERLPKAQLEAIRRSIAQVRQYQQHIMPKTPTDLERPGVRLGLRFTPLDSAGLYFPGGKAAYPSSLIMLTVPAQVAGVARIVVCTPPSRYGRSDLVLAACHELGLSEVFLAGGAAAIAALAIGTTSIPRVDKIVGPGNLYVQLAKRLLSGGVGIDSFLGPSEILIIADDSGEPAFIAADLIAQAEHDPGSCFLLTDSPRLAEMVTQQIAVQLTDRQRRPAIEKALAGESAIVVGASMGDLIDLANRFACEHVNLQTRDNAAVLGRLRHAGAVFVGPHSPVAAGDYVAGPSHCLPTNTTARFSSGISVYEFFQRSGVVQYDPAGLALDARHIIELANAEHLDGHAASVRVRRELRP
jgi:histidinol dehydrogenase